MEFNIPIPDLPELPSITISDYEIPEKFELPPIVFPQPILWDLDTQLYYQYKLPLAELPSII